MNETLDTQNADTTIDTTDTAQMPQLPPPQFNASQAPQFNASQAPQFNATQMPQFNATQMPQVDASQMPQVDASQMPQVDASQMPQFNATQMPQFNATQIPQFDTTQMPQVNASQMPTLDGSQMLTLDGSQMPQMPPPPPMIGQGFMAPPPDMSAWGNGEFNGEQLLNGENLTAPDDLSEITDATADISVNLGEQNGFSFPPAGMMPPFATDGGQLTDQSATTEQQSE